MCVKWFNFLAVLSGLAATGILRAGGMKVYTSHHAMEAVNGTDVRLRCTFDSSVPINPAQLTVSWTFRPLSPGKEESVFYYANKQYPPKEGRFGKKVVWSGDIMGRDASIVVKEVKFTYNGTFSCQVKNPPDVHGNAAEVKLRVVAQTSFSEILKLVLIIGGAVMGVVVLLVLVVSVKRCRKERRDALGEDVEEEAPRRERKDPTVCHPAMAAHLYVSEEEYEIDSSDGMISEASTKDPSSSEEEEQDSDDEGGGYSD